MRIFDEMLSKQLKDEEFRKEYDAVKLEMDIIRENPTSKESIFLWLFGMWGKTGINCFLMITGYFMCCQNITLRKFLKLFLEVLFYNVLIYCVFVLFGYEELSIKNIFHYIVPIRHIKDGFISCFLVFYCFIPFLNILIKNMNKKEHILLILLSLIYLLLRLG